MYDNLITLLDGIAPLTEEELTLITTSFKPTVLKKREFFLRSGEINRHIGYIDKGLVRYFVYKNGEESTFEFTREGEFIADYQSFRNNQVSKQSIQAIEDCHLLTIDYPSLQTIFNTSKHGNLLGRIIVEHRFDVMVNRLLAVYMQNHEDRYKDFVSHYSELTQRIPQYLIASYVGVKPQSLSRIRNRFTQSTS